MSDEYTNYLVLLNKLVRPTVRDIVVRANEGETLSDDELTEIYCEIPDILQKMDRFASVLYAIAGGKYSGETIQQVASRTLGM